MTISNLNLSFSLDNLSIKILKIGYGVFHDSFPNHRHAHGFYELHLVCCGKGKLISDEQEYVLLPGIMYMTGPNTPHEQLTDPETPMEEYYIQFEITPSKKGRSTPSAELLINTWFWIGHDTQHIQFLFDQICDEANQKQIGFIQAIDNMASMIIIKLLRCYSDHQNAEIPSSYTLDDKRLLIIDSCFLYHCADLTLPQLSQQLGLSLRQTQRFLKKNYGKTFIEMRTDARLDRAKFLLRQGMKLSEILQNVGFSDEHYLRKLLHQETL